MQSAVAQAVMMIVLGIETSASIGSVALAQGDAILAQRTFTAGLVHGVELLPAIDQAMAEANLPPASIELIAVDKGPGSYTGTRVGVTAAKTLAYVLDKPLIGVVSLGVLAANAGQAQVVHAVIDARRGRVYVRSYLRREGILEPTTPPEVMAAAEAAKRIKPGDALLGDAIARYPDVFEATAGCLCGESTWQPHALNVCRLGLAEYRRRGGDGVHELAPLYLHRPEAEEIWEKRHGEAGEAVG